MGKIWRCSSSANQQHYDVSNILNNCPPFPPVENLTNINLICQSVSMPKITILEALKILSSCSELFAQTIINCCRKVQISDSNQQLV